MNSFYCSLDEFAISRVNFLPLHANPIVVHRVLCLAFPQGTHFSPDLEVGQIFLQPFADVST